MARRSDGPWFRTGKGLWYCTIQGRKLCLGIRGLENQKEALRAWHRLMAEDLGDGSSLSPTTNTKGRRRKLAKEVSEGSKPQALSIHALASAFLADCQGRMTAGCLRNYRIFLEPFAQAFGDRVAESLSPGEAEAFSKQAKWSSTYQAQCLGCLQSLYRWAIRQRLIATNPIEHCRKPVKHSRGVKALISEPEHKRLMAIADPMMRDFLALLWATGARPGEIAGLEAEQVLASADGLIPLAKHKQSHKGKSRFLILQGDALAIAQARAKAVGSGLLFKGQRGRLTAQAIGLRLSRLCEKAKVRSVIAYGYRHTFATQALANGVPDAQVAALLGHSGTSMLHRHYSHLTAQAQALRDALAMVRA